MFVCLVKRCRYVVSGGDHSELARVFEHHGITAEFVQIRGSGVGGGTKPHHVEEILAKEQVDPARCLFVGRWRHLSCSSRITLWGRSLGVLPCFHLPALFVETLDVASRRGGGSPIVRIVGTLFCGTPFSLSLTGGCK